MLISLENALPGMTLAEDVYGQQGYLLAPKGHQLDTVLIQLCKNYSIASLPITDDSTPSSQQPLSAAPKIAAAPAAQPRFSVAINHDALSARLVVEPNENGPDCELDLATIMQVLAKHEITFGIDTNQIAKLIEQWNQSKRRYELHTIAQGLAPKPAAEGPLQCKLQHITCQKDFELVSKAHYFWEVARELPLLEPVKLRQVVAEKQVVHPAVPGRNIFGIHLFSEEVIAIDLTLQEGVEYSEDKKRIFATSEGVLYAFEDTIGILPLDFNGIFSITVAPNAMSATLNVHPAGPGGSLPGKKELARLIAEQSIVYGIDTTIIDHTIAACASGTPPEEPVIIAQGSEPVHGENGHIEYHFSTTSSLTPKTNSDGSVDYKSVEIVNSVAKNQLLASCHPPLSGVDGATVLGTKILADKGVPARLPVGPHTVPDPSNPDHLQAATDGIVRLTGEAVEVCEGFVIPGNVDFSTGNINYDKTVIVNGDIKSGFDVHCGEDLQISGTIEESHITVGGNLLCRYGFVGQGRGIIEAKGDVNLGFMKNQTVKSFKSITIAKEAINCTLRARNAITVHGSPLSVAGGTLIARVSIIVHTVGNHSGIRTHLEAGRDYLVVEELALLERQQHDLTTQCAKQENLLAGLQKTTRHKKLPTAKEQLQKDEYVASIHHLQQQLFIIDHRKTILSNRMYQLNDASIKIEHMAFAGTMFKFGDRRHLLKEEVSGPKTIRYYNQEIHFL